MNGRRKLFTDPILAIATFLCPSTKNLSKSLGMNEDEIEEVMKLLKVEMYDVEKMIGKSKDVPDPKPEVPPKPKVLVFDEDLGDTDSEEEDSGSDLDDVHKELTKSTKRCVCQRRRWAMS